MKVIARTRKADLCGIDLNSGGIKNAEQSQINKPLKKPIKWLNRKKRFYSGVLDNPNNSPNN